MLREQRIRHGPIEVGPLPCPVRPLGDAPGAGFIGAVGIALPLAVRVVGVAQAISGAHDVAAGARFSGGQAGEGLLIEIIHRENVLHERIQLRACLPTEVGFLQQEVVHFDCREIVPPRIAVALRVEQAGVIFIDETVRIDVVDVVIGIVGGLAEPLGIIPKHPVIDRVALAEIGAPEQRQLLVQQTGLEVLESVGIGRDTGQSFFGIIVDRDRGILRVAIGLAGEQLIEHGEPSGGEQERLIDPIGGGAVAGVPDRENSARSSTVR